MHREQFPFILLPIELTKKMKEEIKIAGLINDAFECTKNDENFKRKLLTSLHLFHSKPLIAAFQ